MQKEKNYITKFGYDRLSKELNNLLHYERPKITELIAWAASNGDRSENADYQYGKRKLREIDSRLRFLQQRLDVALIVDIKEITTKKIQFGATVTLEDENSTIVQYTIVGVDEVDMQKKKISWKSPIGSSLLQKEEGDFIVVKTPSGNLEFEIIKVEYLEDNLK